MGKGKKVYDDRQKRLLAEVEASCRVYASRKDHVEAWLREQRMERMHTVALDRGQTIRDALAAGVTKSDILRALGVKNWGSFVDAAEYGTGGGGLLR